MVERSDRRQEMDVRDNHKMLMTTAVIAAMVAVMATPAQAHYADVEGGGSEFSATAPSIDPNTIPYLNDSVAVATVMGDGPPDAIDRYVANQQVTTLGLGGSPDAIDRYVANQQATTLALGGSPDAIDRYVANGTLVTAQGGSADSWFDRTWLGLGAGFSVLLAAAMAGVFFSARHRGRVVLP
jgi:hypothetical protein